MSYNNYIRISVLSLMLILGAVPKVHAMFPTLDISAITQGVKGVVQQVNQVKTQIMESSVVGSINSAIGDAKSAMSKFSLDEIKAKAKEAEKKLKEANKIKQVAEKIKKAKEAYEQKKKQFDDYKKKLEAAKAKVDEAKSSAMEKVGDAMTKVNDAKSKVAAAQSKVSGAVAKVNEVKSMASSKVGNVMTTVNTAKSKVTAAQSKVGAVVTKANNIKSDLTPKLNASVPQNNIAKPTVLSAPTAKPVDSSSLSGGSLKASTARQAFTAPAPASVKSNKLTVNTSINAPLTKSGVEKAKEISAKEGISAGVQSLDISLSKAVNKKDTEALEEIANIDPADIITSDSKVYDDGTTPLLKSKGVLSSDKKVVTDEKTLTLDKNKTTVPVLTPAKSINNSSETKLVPVNELVASDKKADTVVTQTGTNKIKTPSVSTVLTSSQKVTAPKANLPTLAPAKTVTKSPEVKSEPSKELITSSKPALKTKEELKPTISLEKETEVIVEKPVVNKGKTLTDTISMQVAPNQLSKTPTIGSAKSITEPVVGNGLKVKRQKFQTQPLLQKNSHNLWQDDGDRSRHHSIKLSFNDTLKFGSAECDYNNSIISGDDGEVVILSEAFAKECCLKPEDLKSLDTIRDCARNLVKKMNDPDSTIAAEAYAVFQQISAEQLKYGLAESLDNTNDSTSYLKDVFEPYKKDMTQSSSSRDDIQVLTMANTQLLYLFNRLRRIYTSSLVTGSITSLDSIDSQILNEEVDIGIENDDSEYESSVSMPDIEYPVLPDNFARQCAIKVTESVDGVNACYMNAVKKIHNPDIDIANSATNFAKNIKYQSILDVMAKGLYQKVKSAEYDKKLQETKEQNIDSTQQFADINALSNSAYEFHEIMDDIINLLATRIAHNSIDEIATLHPLSTDKQK